MKKHKRIESDPEVMFGKPVIKGTRVTVEQILYKLGEGTTETEIIKSHPHLEIEDIRAAQRFAADYIGGEEIIFA